MSCIGCENFAKRVSNVYRDEEIKEQFESIIGYEVKIIEKPIVNKNIFFLHYLII